MEKRGAWVKWAAREDTARAKADGGLGGESQGIEPF